jgi:hypothetical protein
VTALAEEAPVGAPTPAYSGTFAVYTTESGGVHLTVRLAGEEGEKHLDVPPHMARIAEQLIAGDMPGSPLAWMKLFRKK